MTDQTQAAADAGLPPLWKSIVRALAQKGLAALATALTGYGVIASPQQGQFVSLGLSIVLWAASFAWTFYHERSAQKRVIVALNAPSPSAAVPSAVLNGPAIAKAAPPTKPAA